MTCNEPTRISSKKICIPEYLVQPASVQPEVLPAFCYVLSKTGPDTNSNKPQHPPQTRPLDLPRHWNTHENMLHVEAAPGNLKLTYTGPGKSDKEAITVRANKCIPSKTAIYYFEVTVLNKGRDGYIAIGFQAASTNTTRLPGWEPNSWGYHADDGHAFACSGTGKTYGPSFTTGDTVGCLLNFIEKTCEFTKNGLLVGVAFSGLDLLSIPLYPAVGLRTPGESVAVNFGDVGFVFDVTQYSRDLRCKFEGLVYRSPFDSELVKDLIMEYLLECGYAETARSLASSGSRVLNADGVLVGSRLLNDGAEREPIKFDESCERRKILREMVVFGDLWSAICFVEEWYPKLGVKSDVMLSLYCLYFISLLHQSMADTLDSSESVDCIMDLSTEGNCDIDTKNQPADSIEKILQVGTLIQERFGASHQSVLDETFAFMCSPCVPFTPAIRQHVAAILNDAILDGSGGRFSRILRHFELVSAEIPAFFRGLV